MLRFLGLCALAMLCSFADPATAFEVHLADDSLLGASSPPPTRRVPVLFVHGHAFESTSNTDDPANPNYKQNFWETPSGLTSFQRTLDHGSNSGLDIEPYYIRFADQARSITEDARDIQDVVDQLIERHNPGFSATAPTNPPPVQVVIIGYSKGTISARQYLKSLQVQVEDLTAPRPNYRPVSEFIAIAPPNHGISFPLSFNSTRLSVRQMHDGLRPAIAGCSSFNDGAATDYITRLNDHPVTDTQTVVSDTFPGEAPGFRREDAPPHSGILYVTIYGPIIQTKSSAATIRRRTATAAWWRAISPATHPARLRSTSRSRSQAKCTPTRSTQGTSSARRCSRPFTTTRHLRKLARLSRAALHRSCVCRKVRRQCLRSTFPAA